MTTSFSEKFWTVSVTAKHFGITQSYIHRLIKDNQIHPQIDYTSRCKKFLLRESDLKTIAESRDSELVRLPRGYTYR